MEQNKDRGALAAPEYLDRTLPLELNAELVLPDYRSEISRLLWVHPTFCPAEQFIGGGKADFSGPVRYELLYAGPDNALYSATVEEGFAFSLALDEGGMSAGETPQFSVELAPESVTGRVVAPRRVSLRTRMHARVRGYAPCDLSVKIKGEGEPARLGAVCDSGRLFGGGRDAITLTEQVEMGAGMRLVSTRGAVFLPEVSAAEDAVLCRGEAIITLLLAHEEGEEAPCTLVRRLPFESRIPLEGVSADCGARATGSIAELNATMGEGELSLQCRVALAAEAQRNEELVLCRDIFLPGGVTECRSAERTLWQAALCTNRNFSVSGELPLSALSLSPDAKVLDAIAEAELQERTQEGGKCILQGEINCRLLMLESGEYGVKQAAFPFRILFDGNAEELAAELCVPVLRVSMSHDALRADAELQLALRGTNRVTVPVLCEATFSPAPAKEVFAGTELYFPTSGETLWAVAKRYGVAPEALAAANDLLSDDPAAPDSLGGARYLLIP